jgi:SAM-dependent methyltransferase
VRVREYGASAAGRPVILLPMPQPALPSRRPGLAEMVERTRLRLWRHLARGEGVECPCCGERFRRFVPYGVPRRPAAQCPACGAVERHRLLWLFLRERTDLFVRPQRLLHVAPEEVFAARLRALPSLRYLSADLASPRAMLRADVQRLPLPDASFDAILCHHVLEHVPDDRAAMGELLRVLRPGGWALLQSPIRSRLAATLEDPAVTDPRERERLYGQSDHLRQYGRDYEARLHEAGFEVRAARFFEALPPERRARYGLKAETIWLCRRPAS